MCVCVCVCVCARAGEVQLSVGPTGKNKAEGTIQEGACPPGLLCRSAVDRAATPGSRGSPKPYQHPGQVSWASSRASSPSTCFLGPSGSLTPLGTVRSALSSKFISTSAAPKNL